MQTQNTIYRAASIYLKNTMWAVWPYSPTVSQGEGSKFFTGFSVSRQCSKALDLSDFPARFQQVQQSASKVPAMFQ